MKFNLFGEIYDTSNSLKMFSKTLNINGMGYSKTTLYYSPSDSIFFVVSKFSKSKRGKRTSCVMPQTKKDVKEWAKKIDPSFDLEIWIENWKQP